MHQDDVQTLVRLLLYGSPASRRRVAARLADEHDAAVWLLLADTARYSRNRVLRARCVEVLGVAAAGAERHRAELILSALLG